ncbi:hypothetical protein ABBQ38_001556 [Trebouxia sp. C0009 RCD-2024]
MENHKALNVFLWLCPQFGTINFGVLQVHAAEVALYGKAHARIKHFTFTVEADRLHPLSQEAFLGDAPLSPEEVVPGGDFAQHVLQDIMEPVGSVGAGLLSLTNNLQGGPASQNVFGFS